MIKAIEMKSFILALFVIQSYCSCTNNDSKQSKSPYETLCSNFLLDISEKNFSEAKSRMDTLFLNAVDNITLDSSLNRLSKKIESNFGSKILTTLVSTENTYHENFPATFLIFKVESAKDFGYFFFYVNDESKKILLVSEFARVKQKR